MANRLENDAQLELSPLQQAAFDRILEFKKELADQGIYMRTGMELEFMVADENGQLTPQVIPLPDITVHQNDDSPFSPDAPSMLIQRDPYNPALEYLRDKHGLKKVGEFKHDGSSEYEVTVADITDVSMPGPKQFAPEKIAATMEYLKEQALPSLLQSSCLTSEAKQSGHHFEPVFRALPYEKAFMPGITHKTRTSALHVNVSLYDKHGNNLFQMHPALMDHCCKLMTQLQRDAALAVMPNENSLARIGNNDSAPHGIGVVSDHLYIGDAARHTTVQKHTTALEQENDGVRIENRLPGADADPYVALAMTMASLVDAVRQHTSPGPDGLTVEPFTERHDKYDIPKPYTKLIEKFESSARAKELLGNKLFNAVLHDYRPTEIAM